MFVPFFDRLFDALGVNSAVVSGSHWSTTRSENASSQTASLEKMIHVLELEALCLREKEVDHGNLEMLA